MQSPYYLMEKEKLIRYLKACRFPEKILNAFKKVQREDFIPQSFRELAYKDQPLPIGHGQTISQPYTIAFMLNLLELKDNQKILEVGSGSGYVLALISEISKNSKIFGKERIEYLVRKSKQVLKNKKNIKIIHGDGSKGLQKEKPFDRILVSASSRTIPKKLVEQLKVGGILVIPVGTSILQLKKHKNKEEIREFPGFIFVPLIED